MVTQNAKSRVIVGLEIHVQLRTQTKLFCGCPLRSDAPPNTCVCEVCLGHPGSLPVINEQAIRLAALAGVALNCSITRRTKWDRKSYYYPDMPKNYQISQYDQPIATNGSFEFDVAGEPRSVRIRRAHLEEDAGKNIHDTPGGTLVDLNRAGTPLLEIVTEPDIASAEEAYVFCTELQRLVVHLGISEANMQKGQMRFEPNINIAIEQDGHEVRTPIAEVKNLNSFRSVRQAVEYESWRQFDQWKRNPDYILGKSSNENRGWDANRGMTEFQRGKEGAHDYRYFPEPDLVPVDVTEEFATTLRKSLVELPVLRRRRLIERYGLSFMDANTLIDDRPTADLFEQVVNACGMPDFVGKQFINAWLKLANDRGVGVTELNVDALRMAQLATMTRDGTVSATAATQLAEAMLTSTDPPATIAAKLGLVQVQDEGATATWVAEAFAANEQAVRDALANPKKMQAAAGFLRGQVMKISGGKADPKLVGTLIERELEKRRSS